MSLDLRCPNCGAVIGETSSENNYEPVYYYNDGNDNPKCISCGSSDETIDFENGMFKFFIIVFIIIMSLGIIFSI